MKKDLRAAITPIDLPADFRFEPVFTAGGVPLRINQNIPATERTRQLVIEQTEEK